MAIKSRGYGILGIGHYVPENVVTNADMEAFVDTSDEWIITRTGIKERRKLDDDKATSDMAVIAAERALEASGIDRSEIEILIMCTFSPDQTVPCCATVVQEKLGIAGQCPTFDLNAACTGFVYGLTVATGMMRGGLYQKALVIGADAVTRSIDYGDRNTCVLFGDGAGAAVVGETGPDRGIVGEFHCADGTQGRNLQIYDTGSALRTEEQKAKTPYTLFMDGREIFKFATRVLGEATNKALENADQGLTVDDLDILFPHQANLRIIESAAKRLGIPMEKVFVNIQKYGNTSAASIPIALSEAVAEGRLKSGDLIGLVAFGGGVTYGSNIWIW